MFFIQFNLSCLKSLMKKYCLSWPVYWTVSSIFIYLNTKDIIYYQVVKLTKFGYFYFKYDKAIFLILEDIVTSKKGLRFRPFSTCVIFYLFGLLSFFLRFSHFFSYTFCFFWCRSYDFKFRICSFLFV